jgi:hypothetical protein
MIDQGGAQMPCVKKQEQSAALCVDTLPGVSGRNVCIFQLSLRA